MSSDPTTYKILLSNIGYLTNLHGKKRHYLTRGHRFIWPKITVENEVVHKFKKLVQREDPDLICFIEIKHDKQIFKFLDESYIHHVADSKYTEENFVSKLFNFSNKGNGFLSKNHVPYHKHYLQNGVKRLIYHLELPGGVNLIIGHFALKRKVRQKQFKELHDLFGHLPRKIICGDFNIFHGHAEIAELQKDSQLISAHDDFTFPAHDPKKTLDLVLHSEDIDVRTNVLKEMFSDHLPISFEYTV